MKIFKTIKAKFTREGHHPRQGGLEIFKYIGPGLLVTVGFIDPGNWASNLAARSRLRLCPAVDGHALDDHADRPAA